MHSKEVIMKFSKKSAMAALAMSILFAGAPVISGSAFAANVRPNPPGKIGMGTFCSGHLKLCYAAKIVCGRC